MREMILTTVVLFAALICRADQDFAHQQALLSRPGTPGDIAGVLGLLKADPGFAPLFRSYTLAKNSMSLQKSSPDRPRVVMFGDTAQMIVSFNDRAFDGGASLETAEYDRDTHRLNYREILFKRELPEGVRKIFERAKSFREANPEDLDQQLGLTAGDIETETDRFVVTRKNPPKCLQCHSFGPAHPQSARYVWTEYDSWPAFFGSNDDMIYDDEAVALKKFHLFARCGNAAAARYATIDPSAFPVGTPDRRSTYRERPNLRLTKLIAANQAEVSTRFLAPTESELNRLSYVMFCREHEVSPTISDDDHELLPLRQAVEALPTSLALFPDDYGFNMGSPALSQGSLRLTELEYTVLVRDYLLKTGRTSLAVRNILQANLRMALTRQKRSSGANGDEEELHDANTQFLSYLSSYYAWGDLPTAELCRLLAASNHGKKL